MTSRPPALIRIRTDEDDADLPPAPGSEAATPSVPPPYREIDDVRSVGDRIRSLLVSGGETNPLYPRVLRLRNVNPNGWQRAALVEGMVLVGALAALADKATSWAPLIMPLAAAGVVKFHDVLVGLLPRRDR